MARTEVTLRATVDFSALGLAQAIVDVAKERQRQIEVEGWTPEHDDIVNSSGELAVAAACYAHPFPLADPLERLTPNGMRVPKAWPWDDEWWKPVSFVGLPEERRRLVKSAALLIAAIEQLDRQSGTLAEPAGSGDADGGGDGNDDHPDVAAPRAIEGEPTARSAIAPEWWYAAEDPEQSGDFYDAVGDVPYGDPFQVFGAATVKTVWFARLTPAEDSETDDDWECEAASEHECQALIDAERRRRAAATASTEGAA